eukprot:4636361-Prymnesium_polylepis.3
MHLPRTRRPACQCALAAGSAVVYRAVAERSSAPKYNRQAAAPDGKTPATRSPGPAARGRHVDFFGKRGIFLLELSPRFLLKPTPQKERRNLPSPASFFVSCYNFPQLVRARDMGGRAQRARAFAPLVWLCSCWAQTGSGSGRLRCPHLLASRSLVCVVGVEGVLSEGPEGCGAALGGRSCVEGKFLL